MSLLLLLLGRILATLGYRPATITAFISFSFSAQHKEKKKPRCEQKHGQHTAVKTSGTNPKFYICTIVTGRWQVDTVCRQTEIPEFMFELGSLGSLQFTNPAAKRCSANWPFMFWSICGDRERSNVSVQCSFNWWGVTIFSFYHIRK